MASGDKVVLYKGNGIQRWRFRVIAANGKTVGKSEEGFLTKWNAKRAATKRYPGTPIEEEK